MGSILVYRNRTIKQEDIDFIRRLITEHPEDGRCAVSRRICRAWNWVQPNGLLKEMICRGLLLRLEREGFLVLPERRCPPPNPLLHRKPPAFVEVDDTPIEAPVRELFPITFYQVRRTPYERLFNGLIEQYHYLGYTHPVGEFSVDITRGAPQVPGLYSWKAHCSICLVFPCLASWSAGPFHRMEH